MQRLLIIFSLMFIMLTTTVSAKDIDGQFAVYGIGSNSCTQYNQTRAAGRTINEYVTWLEAYLSAFNLIVSNTYDIAGGRNLDEFVDWMDDHCKDNPDQAFVNAVATLTTVLYDSRMNLSPQKDNAAKWNTIPR
jgi:hypothetical protein